MYDEAELAIAGERVIASAEEEERADRGFAAYSRRALKDHDHSSEGPQSCKACGNLRKFSERLSKGLGL